MRIAITGAAGYFGRKIIERLHERDDVEYIFGISRREFKHSYEKLEYRRMDVRESELKKIFKEKEIDAVIHLAFVLNPIHNEREMHDININGARNVLEAAEHAGVEKIIMTSSTMVYGAWPDNPEYLTEDSPLRGHKTYYYNRDKIEIEKMCSAFIERNPDISMVILRPCLVLGPSVEHFYSKLLNLPFLPLVGGENPRMQFLHEDDVARAYEHFLFNGDGIYNIVGRGVMRWKEVIEMAGRRAISTPAWLLYSATKLLWKLHLTFFPPEILDFVRWPWVASGERAKKAGFVAEYTTEETLKAFLQKAKR